MSSEHPRTLSDKYTKFESHVRSISLLYWDFSLCSRYCSSAPLLLVRFSFFMFDVCLMWVRGGVCVPEVRSSGATNNSVLDPPFAAVDNFDGVDNFGSVVNNFGAADFGVAIDFGEVFGHHNRCLQLQPLRF